MIRAGHTPSGDAERAAALHRRVTELEDQLAVARRDAKLFTALGYAQELLAGGAPLENVLDAVAVAVESRLDDGRCTMLVADDGGRLRHASAPSLPDEYAAAVDGLAIAEGVGTCGTAAFRRRRVITTDISRDPNWSAYHELAEKFDLRSCWSQPMLGSDGTLLGTFAIYDRACRTPLPQEITAVECAAHLAGVAIERKRAEAELARAHDEMQRITGAISDFLWSAEIDADGHFEYRYYSPVVETITGRPPEYFMASCERWLDTVHFEDRPRVRASLARLLSGGSTHEEDEYRVVRPDGDVRFVRDSIMVRPNGMGGFRFDGVVADITARRRAEDIRRQAEQELEQRVRERTAQLQAANRKREAEISERRGAQEALVRSEAQFRSLCESAPLGILLTDAAGDCVYSNETLQALCGLSMDDCLGRGWTRSIHLPDRAAVLAAVDEVLGSHQPHEMEFRLQRPDGVVRTVEFRAAPIWSGPGKMAGQVGTVVDITARQEAEAARRLTQFGIDSSSDAAFWVGADSKFIYVNGAACRSLGYSRAELLAMTVGDIDVDCPSERWPQIWERLKREGTLKFESQHCTRAGKLFPVELSVSYLAFAGREYACAFARDISDRKRAEAERAALEGQLRHAQKIEAVGELASGVAHEFNNLLLIIGEGLERARRAVYGNSTLSESLQLIEQAAGDAEGVIRSLLTFGHEVAPGASRVEFGGVVRESVELLRRMFPASIELQIQTTGEPMWVEADPSQLRQVILNLALNARDAMPSGGQLSVTLHPAVAEVLAALSEPVADDADFVQLEISDTGRGVPSELHSRIFDPFFTTKPRTRGTGLGLSVVHGIIRDHHGFITVRSECGQGARFNVLLPRVAAPLEAGPAASGPELRASPRGRVLVAEDHERIRSLVAAYLQGLGCEVLEARDGDQVMSLFDSWHARLDIVVLDLDLPRRSGGECLQLIRARDPRLPVVIITGDPSTAVNGLLDDHTVLLRKPFRIATLAERIGSLLDVDDA